MQTFLNEQEHSIVNGSHEFILLLCILLQLDRLQLNGGPV